MGIPAGGLFTGAEVAKTDEEAAIWGGTAAIAYDPCYHLACDTCDNINLGAYDVNVDAVAFATLTYAYSTKDVNAARAMCLRHRPGVRRTSVRGTPAGHRVVSTTTTNQKSSRTEPEPW